MHHASRVMHYPILFSIPTFFDFERIVWLLMKAIASPQRIASNTPLSNLRLRIFPWKPPLKGYSKPQCPFPISAPLVLFPNPSYLFPTDADHLQITLHILLITISLSIHQSRDSSPATSPPNTVEIFSPVET